MSAIRDDEIKIVKEHDTLPKLLRRNYELFGDEIAEREKDYGLWRTYTWKEVYEHVKYLCGGLISLGFKKGEKATMIGENEPELFWAELAVICAGGVVTALYPDSIPSELEYIFKDSESVIGIAEDQEQVDKFLELKDRLPSLRKVLYWDEKGMWLYDDPILMSFKDVQELGKKYEQQHPGFFEEMIEQGNTNDKAVIIYTSGTTGDPKGTLWDHKMLLDNAERYAVTFPELIREGAQYLTYISPAWSAEQCFGIALGLYKRMIVNFPEEPETVLENIREVAPEILFFGPRQWEHLVSTTEAKMLDANWLQRFFYRMFMAVGYRIAQYKLEGKEPSPIFKVLHLIGEGLLFRPLKDKLGIMKLKLPITAGTSISPDLFRFYYALNVPLRQGWGSTEIGWLTIHQDDIRFETCGRPFAVNETRVAPVEVRLQDDGELVARGGTFFQGYYNKPEASAAKVDSGGWYHMGDAGNITDDGHIIVYDRLEDLRTLSTGTRFSPQFIEVRLRFSPFIRDVLVVGDEQKPFTAAIVDIDPETVGRWAERNRIPYTTFPELSQKVQVRKLIRDEIATVNKSLEPGAHIRKFVNLHKPFDPDEGDLTRSRKLRRFSVEQRYKDIIDSIYSGEREMKVETPVKYRDGRTGVISTKIYINDMNGDNN